MLIFGGRTARDRKINGTDIWMFDRCEYYDEKFDILSENRPYSYRNCGEELMADIWRYHVRRKIWTHIKIGARENSNLAAPYARYGHTGCYV